MVADDGFPNRLPMTGFIDDIRQAFRALLRAPRFSLMLIGVLAMGIGAGTAMFSALHRLAFDNIPYAKPDRLLMLWDRAPDGERQHLTFGSYRELEARTTSFTGMAAMRPWRPALVGEAGLRGQQVSASYFDVLGVRPALGAGFDPATDRPQALKTVVISDALWQRNLHADPGVIGKLLTLDDRAYTVVGVMPAGFVDVLSPSADVWSTLQYDPALPTQGREWGHHLRLVARLKDGVPLEAARQDVATVAANPTAEFARPSHALLDLGMQVNHVHDELNSAIRPSLYAAFGAALLLLLIACANAANLLSVRALQRRREIEARVILGAAPTRLLRLVVFESLLLALASGAAGLALTYVILRAMASLAPAGMSGFADVAIDGIAALFALSVAAGVGLIIGLIPAFRALRIGQRSGAPRAASRTIGGERRARNLLVIAEVTMAMVMLISSSLLVRSLQQLHEVDVGFESAQRLTLNVHVGGPRYDDAGTRRFFDEALASVRQLPGIESAAYTSQIPFSGGVETYGVRIEAIEPQAPMNTYEANRHTVSPGLFATLGIPIIAGRALNERDRRDAPPSAVIGASLAKRAFGEQNPLGRRLQVGPPDSPWFDIVGVAGDVHDSSLTSGPDSAFYVTAAQWRFADQDLSFVVHTRDAPTSQANAIAAAIHEIDPDRPITRVADLDDLVASASADQRFSSTWISLFGISALLLAAIGIYGVLAIDVSERRSEIGLRLALGASRSGLGRWVLRGAMLSVLIGIVLGVVIASGVTGLMQSLLYGIAPIDPASFLLAPLLLAATAFVACLAPLARALRIDPARSMLNE